ncbi:MAG: helix-turn-helix transcriptional regulator [Rhodobacteraceae bacterium]|nr:helix-turn-helix transcriptional regulator [Paracoccaceae bacterium]
MSYQMRLSARSRKAARFISGLQKKIQNELISSGKTQQEVATILGVDRSVVNRRLKGGANLTARSIADFAYAFDKDVVIEFVDRPGGQKANWASSDISLVGVSPSDVSGPKGSIKPNSQYELESTSS